MPLGRNSDCSLVETSSMLGETVWMTPAMTIQATMRIAMPRQDATLVAMALNNLGVPCLEVLRDSGA